MKKHLTSLFLIGFINLSMAGSLDSFFKSTVKNGTVNYSLIKEKKQADLNLFIDSLNSIIQDKPTKASYINLYNLLVIKQVIKNYPTSSPTNIPGFFESNKFTVGNKEITLNHLENKVIRPTYNDPRIHFALVCGAMGCPPIQTFAYNDAELNEQLNLVTTNALNDSLFIRIQEDGSAKISEIFKWYLVDFGGNNKSIIEFINKYRANQKIKALAYYQYDWSLNDFQLTNSGSGLSNIAVYTPSVLLKKGQLEVQFFNNLYTQNAWFNDQGERTKLNGRGSWNTLMMSFNYGVSKSNRFNIGLDVNLRSTRNSNDESEGAIQIFRFANDESNRTTISAIGPKIKVTPIKSLPKFSVQSAFWIPIAENLEAQFGERNQPWLDWQRYTSWTQLFFDKPIGSKYQLFTELDLLLRIPQPGLKDANPDAEINISTPMSLFFSYFPTKKSTIYSQAQYAPTLSAFPSYFTQVGLGGKYQLFPQLQIEASYTNFVAGHTQGAGATFNLGLRYISK